MKNENLIYISIVAGVVLQKDGKYLLVQEKKPQCYGKWNFPAGKLHVGETVEEVAIREAKEESGLDVKLIKKIGVYHDGQYRGEEIDPVKHAFLAEIVGGELNLPESEILDAKWFTTQEILSMKKELRAPWVWQAIEDLTIKENK